MRVVLAADSNALPRPGDRLNGRYTDLYGDLLRKRLSLEMGCEKVEVLNNGRRSYTIRMLDEPTCLYDVVLAWEPDVAILQIGTVDCAPRVFTEFEHKIVTRIRPVAVRERFLQFVGRHRRFIIQHNPHKVYVPLPEFLKRYYHVRDQLLKSGIKICMINICPTTHSTEYRSPGLSENIIRYNKVISEASLAPGCTLVDIHSLFENKPENYILTDGIHINKEGHAVLANLIHERLSDLNRLIPIK